MRRIRDVLRLAGGGMSKRQIAATRTRALPDWIVLHTRAFTFFGGVPPKVVSNNLKSRITKTCFYVPAVKRS